MPEQTLDRSTERLLWIGQLEPQCRLSQLPVAMIQLVVTMLKTTLEDSFMRICGSASGGQDSVGELSLEALQLLFGPGNNGRFLKSNSYDERFWTRRLATS